MGLTVITPATAGAGTQPGDLCLLADVKAELAGDPGVAGTSFDALLNSLITQGSGAIQNFLNRIPAQQVYRETAPGFGGTMFTLAQSPVVTVADALFQGFAVTDFTVDDPEAGILYRQHLWDYTVQVGWVLGGLVVPSTAALDATGGWQIDYTAGWVLPSQFGAGAPPVPIGPTAPALPADIRKACIELVKFWYLRRRLDPDVAERRIDNLILRYREGMDSKPPRLPRTVEWLLRPFQRIIVGMP